MILHTPHYPIDKSIPGFSVFRGHKRIESVNRYHMEIANMNIEKAFRGEPTITKNDIIYTRVYDSVRLPDDPKIKNLTVAISFQEHTYGNFAVIRNARGKKSNEQNKKKVIDWNSINKETAEQIIAEYHKSYPNLSDIEIFQKLYMTNFEVDKEEFKKQVAGTNLGTKVYDYIIWAEQRKNK